jgi:hypothetical protein
MPDKFGLCSFIEFLKIFYNNILPKFICYNLVYSVLIIFYIYDNLINQNT